MDTPVLEDCPYTYYYDRMTDTVRCYDGENQVGKRWCKKKHIWSDECCARSGCQWDEIVTEEQAQKIINSQ